MPFYVKNLFLAVSQQRVTLQNYKYLQKIIVSVWANFGWKEFLLWGCNYFTVLLLIFLPCTIYLFKHYFEILFILLDVFYIYCMLVIYLLLNIIV